MELRAFRRCLERLTPPEFALDVAAGTGRIADVLAAAGARVTLADISEAMLSRQEQGRLSSPMPKPCLSNLMASML
jgi:ubiquinone/menaquinone biosynthesis C-methylase UbiE